VPAARWQGEWLLVGLGRGSLQLDPHYLTQLEMDRCPGSAKGLGVKSAWHAQTPPPLNQVWHTLYAQATKVTVTVLTVLLLCHKRVTADAVVPEDSCLWPSCDAITDALKAYDALVGSLSMI